VIQKSSATKITPVQKINVMLTPMARLGTEITQTLAKMDDTHWSVRIGNQSMFEKCAGKS
jgi:hypothetical protein